MQMPAALLEKFFSGKCTEAEKLRVQAYLRQHPELLDEYFTENAWQQFETPEELPTDLSGRMFATIEKHTEKEPQLPAIFFRWAAVAAALLICLGAWQWMNRPLNNQNIIAHVPQKSPSPEIVKFKFQVNTTDRNISITLADGSTVELAPASEIRYAQTFPSVNRNIYLKGKALFRVAADKARPFTVYAGHLATTALGTIFRVSEQGQLKVALLQGSVVVRPDSLLSSKGLGDTYLKPGQQLSFDEHSFAISVKHIPQQIVPAVKKIIPKQIFQFDNQPLADIINTLETTHHLKFIYADSLISNVNFTGVFNENKESLDDFLNTVCLLNNLTIEKKEDGIHIVPNDR